MALDDICRLHGVHCRGRVCRTHVACTCVCWSLPASANPIAPNARESPQESNVVPSRSTRTGVSPRGELRAESRSVTIPVKKVCRLGQHDRPTRL